MRPREREVETTSHNWNPVVQDIEPGQEYSGWYRLIESYNRKDIAYPTDKLPALAGLAKSFQERVKNEFSEDELEYVAGLWNRHLTPGLLWRVGYSSRSYRSKPPLKYIVPSWSWASVMHAGIETDWDISMNETSEVESFRLIEVQCNVDGANEFGQVTDGTILVSGQLRDDLELDPFDEGLGRELFLVWRCVGKAILDERVTSGARIWCLPILVKTIYPPDTVGGHTKGRDWG